MEIGNKDGLWESRYKQDRFFYGKEPNEFVRDHASNIRAGGHVLEVASGEGRNAVFLATEGWTVTAVEPAGSGIEKTRRLAQERGVEAKVDLWQGELSSLPDDGKLYEGAVITFLHLPAESLDQVIRNIKVRVAPGGVFLGEWFHPRQVEDEAGTGGPGDRARMVTPDFLRDVFGDWEIVLLEYSQRSLDEGRHQGPAHLTHIVARKPAPGRS